MNTLARLQALLTKNYPLQQDMLIPEALLTDLEIDSLGMMELFFCIEDEFKLSIPHEKIELKTIGDVVEYIDQLIGQQHGASTVPSTAASAAP